MIIIIVFLLLGLLFELVILIIREQRRGIISAKPWYRRIRPPYAEIVVKKDRKRRPNILEFYIQNTDHREIDVVEMQIHFTKPFQRQSYRITKVKGVAVFPLFLNETGSTSIEIQLSDFYQQNKSLECFYAVRCTFKERGGREYGSKKISLWRYK